MARPKKQTVEYFPHFATSGKTLYILENSFGNDGYAFWFKLLELLANTNGHVLDTNNTPDWKFLVAKTLVKEETATEILNMLSELSAIDTDLWSQRIIWCQNLVDNVEDVYKKRRTKKPEKPSISNNCDENPHTDDVPVTETSSKEETTDVTDSRNPQSKVKETKVNKTKVNNNSIEEKNTPAADAISKINAHEFYQNNFGVENPTVMQSIEYWIEDLTEELVIEALRRAALDKKGFKYAEGIMKNWDKKNIKTMEEVKGEDVAFANQNKKSSSFSKQPIRKETEPEWAKEGYVPPVFKSEWTAEDQAEFEKMIGE